MTLRLKFVVLIGLMTLTVVASLTTSLWSSSLEADASRDVVRVSRTLDHLRNLRRRGDAIRTIASSEDVRSGEAVALKGLAAQLDDLHRAFTRLEAAEGYRSWAGFAIASGIRDAVEACRASGAAWQASGAATDAAAVAGAGDAMVRLMDHCERRVLEGAAQAIRNNERLSRRIAQTNAFALVAAGLISILAYALLRRWIVTPIARLREAAAHISRGEFEYRLPVHGRDEIAQLSAEVNHMASVITSMQQERIERERFVTVGQMARRLAHNLRNPLSGIRGLAELTRSDLPAGSELRENQDRIVSSVDKFEQWLAELLDLTSPLELRVRPQAVAPWLADLVDAHAPMARTRRVEVLMDASAGPEEAAFDPRHLGHAVVAVLSNAIEAASAGGCVRVTTRPADPDQWAIRIQDSGPGVRPEIRDQIFSPHFTTKSGGNGIGLAVAQQITRAHGGRVTVLDPESGASGAIFDLSLPCVPPTRSPD
ncbi:MAG: HAMP domain-containing sensor histidine kinase [Phycisphaerales bacterium]